MKIRCRFSLTMKYLLNTAQLCLAALLSFSSPVIAVEDPVVTILYTSDELGYLEPCG